MSPEKYRERALKRSPMLDTDGQLALCGLGLAGEAGEVADHIKKALFHGKPLDYDHLVEELGDVLWYLDRTLAFLGVDLEYCMVVNDLKLERRYPVGFEAKNQAGEVVIEIREGDPTP